MKRLMILFIVLIASTSAFAIEEHEQTVVIDGSSGRIFSRDHGFVIDLLPMTEDIADQFLSLSAKYRGDGSKLSCMLKTYRARVYSLRDCKEI